MEIWHQKQFEKYEPLSPSIKSVDLSVHLFAVEVGASGYCSTTLKSCLSHLDFSSKLPKSTIKELSLSFSFQSGCPETKHPNICPIKIERIFSYTNILTIVFTL